MPRAMAKAPSEAHRYNNGALYRLARGQGANRRSFDDALAATHVVVDLAAEETTPSQMLHLVEREMRIRFYKPRSIKAYCAALRGFLRWLDAPPATANRELLRQYLEMLVDGGASASWVAVNLAAIRTCFDKMCGGTVTTGLVTPRRRTRRPRVLSRDQVVTLLSCVASPRYRLILSLIYATGMRLGEAIRLRGRDIELDGEQIIVWRGKGDKSRSVPLPKRLVSLLRACCGTPDAFVFRSLHDHRHVGPRSVQRAIHAAAVAANLGAGVSCHTLRHSFATHLLEEGMDVRVIQTLLGHERLETTHIYTHVASLSLRRIASPFDSLATTDARLNAHGQSPTFRLTIRPDGRVADVIVTLSGPKPTVIPGIEIEEQRPGWLCMRLPPAELWNERLSKLSSLDRATLDSTEFYERLRTVAATVFVKRRSQD